MTSDPVFYSRADDDDDEHDGLAFVAGWYWCDETWSWLSGPYDTEAQARAALAEYAEQL